MRHNSPCKAYLALWVQTGNLLNVAAPLTYNFMALSNADADEDSCNQAAFFKVIGKVYHI